MRKPTYKSKTSNQKKAAAPSIEPQRLQKFLASRGVASRRAAEVLIENGRIKVNGEVAKIGQKVLPTDRIHIDGKLLPLRKDTPATKVICYHKPTGEICTQSDPEGRPTVFSSIPKGRWVMVGRLDVNTEGLLLFTNDGQLAEHLMHPRYEVEREYAVRVLGEVSDETLQQLQAGVMLEDGLAKFENVVFAGGEGANRWYHVTLKEGRNREVRRMWETLGHKVSRLTRVRYGNFELPRSLRRGKYQFLEPEQIAALQSLYNDKQS
jgi:23S rRNA pseudouridine2605 synthase